MFLLGLGHRARHGKNTAAKAIVQHCCASGLYAKEYAFADALKSYCRIAFGMKEKDAPLLQLVGTDLFRKQDPDIWVRTLMYAIEEQQPDVAIITDMRFPNEAEAITSRGGKTIKVGRVNPDGSLWVAQDRDPNHPSEVALDDYKFDCEISVVSGATQALIMESVSAFKNLYADYWANKKEPLVLEALEVRHK